MADLRQKTFGKRQKPLADLSDAELEEELRSRRLQRLERLAAGSGVDRAVAQYYANLELKPGASLDEVQRAYDALAARYDPSKHASDPQRHKAALELLESLKRAYDALVRHLTAR